MKSKGTKSSKKYTTQEKFINVFAIGLFVLALGFIGFQSFYTARSDHESASYYTLLPPTTDTIAHTKVCMADDIYQGDYPTIAAPLLSKTYYACDQKGIRELTSDQTRRMGIDPISKKEVDKALAIIAIDPKRDGKVLYFQSRETHAKYVQSLNLN
jgi:YHS domain-containing protein